MKYVNAPIHDLLIRIKNSYLARRKLIQGVTYSKFKEDVLKLLKDYHFVTGYEVTADGNKKLLSIHLKEVKDPTHDIPVIKFYSKPSLRHYVGYKKLKTVAGGRGIGIISTSEGLMPTHVAKAKKVG